MSAVQLPLEIPPGFVKTNSPNAAKGRFIDGDKVRFEKGVPEKWAGWTQFIPDQLVGIARGATSWSNKYGNTNAAIGTHIKLYAITGDDTLTDITPIRASGTINSNPFAMTNGSTTVTVTDTTHGADVGDYVTFSGATAAGGITISGEYAIASIIDNNSYTIVHSAAATSTTTGGGASVTAAYQINIGTAGGVFGLGWGAGPWGEGTWGTPRADGIAYEARIWSLVEYGNDLMASPSGGTLYLWEEATDARAEVVTGAPDYIRSMFVTGERFVMALGSGADGTTPMTVRWPDQDDITDWTPSPSNTANIRTLQSGSKLVAGLALADGINLIWSDTSVYLFQYTGSDEVYNTRLAATNCGLIAPHAVTKVNGVAYWMSYQRFYMYGSGVQTITNAEDVQDWVFRRMNQSQIAKVWCEYDPKQHQVRWFYCSGTNTEPDSYVDVDLHDFSWTTGTIERTAGTTYRTSDATSLWVSSDGTIYLHGVGLDADGDVLESYVTFGLYALTRGEANVDVFGVIPDCERQTGNLTYEIYTKERPNSAANFDTQTVTMAPTDEIGDARVSGRHFGMTVRSNVLGGDYRLGIVNLETNEAGRRR